MAGVEMKAEGPGTLSALMDLARLVGRSRAPWLKTRLTGAILLTLMGKALGVLAPLALGAAVNRLAADQGAAVGVAAGFVAFAVGWALIRFLSSAAPPSSNPTPTPRTPPASCR